ncbi:MAG TPA: LD-carboxypeptidase [Rectinemataceae bacterium]
MPASFPSSRPDAGAPGWVRTPGSSYSALSAPYRVKPSALKRGDKLSLVGPSGSTADRARVDASIEALESMGFRVHPGTHCADVYGYLAGSDRDRASDFMEAFLDPETRGVVCLKGGYGAMRILPYLDFSAIAAHPKAFWGYSDITALHLALGREAGLCTIHGPMPSSDMVPEFPPASRESLEDALFGTAFPRKIENPDGSQLVCIVPGVAEGEMVGGNLSLVASTMGTPWQIDPEGKIILLEDIDEAPYRIDRMLCQLALAGVFERCAGIVAASWTRCVPGEGKRTLSIPEIFEDIVAPAGKPLVMGLAAGHCSPSLSLPLGVAYRLDACACELSLLESPWA